MKKIIALSLISLFLMACDKEEEIVDEIENIESTEEKSAAEKKVETVEVIEEEIKAKAKTETSPVSTSSTTSSESTKATETPTTSTTTETKPESKTTATTVVTEPVSETKSFSITAKKWSFSPSTITVNEGDTVKLSIKSTDVDHGFFLSAFGVSENLKAGTTTNVSFIASKAGTYSFTCSVFCGGGHSDMSGTLIVK